MVSGSRDEGAAARARGKRAEHRLRLLGQRQRAARAAGAASPRFIYPSTRTPGSARSSPWRWKPVIGSTRGGCADGGARGTGWLLDRGPNGDDCRASLHHRARKPYGQPASNGRYCSATRCSRPSCGPCSIGLRLQSIWTNQQALEEQAAGAFPARARASAQPPLDLAHASSAERAAAGGRTSCPSDRGRGGSGHALRAPEGAGRDPSKRSASMPSGPGNPGELGLHARGAGKDRLYDDLPVPGSGGRGQDDAVSRQAFSAERQAYAQLVQGNERIVIQGMAHADARRALARPVRAAGSSILSPANGATRSPHRPATGEVKEYPLPDNALPHTVSSMPRARRSTEQR